MSFWQRLMKALGFSRPTHLTFEVEQDLIQSLQDLAEREQRPEEEIAGDLLTFALAQRDADEVSLRRWQALSPREQQVAGLICLGYTNPQIADQLVISPETVKTHVRNVLYKFDMRSKTELRQSLAHWDFSVWRETGS